MLHLFTEILFLSICISAFISPKWSVCFFLVHKILVPVSYITIGSLFFPSNYLALIIFLGYVIRNGRKHPFFSYLPMKFYAIYFFLCTLFAFFSWDFSLSIGFIRSDFLAITLVPFVMLNIAKFDPESWNFIKKFCIVVITVAIAYGLFLIPLKGLNPYTNELKALVGGKEFSEKWLMEEGRVFGRITGTFVHPMYYANFLLCALLFVVYFIRKQMKGKYMQVLAVLVLVCLLTCGVRSGILALGCVFIAYCFFEKKIKVLGYVTLGLFVIGLCSYLFPAFYDYLISPFTSDSVASAKGSSLSMRMLQMNKAWDAISENFLFGNGYGWTTWFIQQIGNHPYLLAFESLVIKIICEGGACGVLAFVWLYYRMFTMKIGCETTKLFCRLMIIAYISYTTFTGDYLYSSWFIIFYSMIYGDNIVDVYCGQQKK